MQTDSRCAIPAGRYRGAIAERVADHDLRAALRLPALNVLPEQGQAVIVQRGFWFVEQQHLGVGQAQPGKQRALQLSAR